MGKPSLRAVNKERSVVVPAESLHLELGVMVVCNACGRMMRGSWVKSDSDRQIVIAVEKCNCDSPLLKG